MLDVTNMEHENAVYVHVIKVSMENLVNVRLVRITNCVVGKFLFCVYF